MNERTTDGGDTGDDGAALALGGAAHRVRFMASTAISGAERAGGARGRVPLLQALGATGKLTGHKALARFRRNADATDGGPGWVSTVVHGLHITAPTWWDLTYLYGEVFVGRAYHFEATTDRPFIVDAGANIGMATLYFKRLYPNCRILAFEPNAAMADIYEENVRNNGFEDVHLERAALCATDGEIDFFVDSSLAGGLTSSMNASRVTGEVQHVPAARLSSFLDAPVDMLKLDVEGGEHDVMTDLVSSGAISTVRRMTIEYHHHITPEENRLGGFLAQLEGAGLGYQIHAPTPAIGAGIYQDLAIDAYQRSELPAPG